MDGWRDQRSEPRTEPFIPALSEIGTSRPRCSRADFRCDHRPQDSWYWAKIRACGNVEEIRGDQQAAGDTPPGGVGAKDRERGSLVSAEPQLPERTKAPIDWYRRTSGSNLTLGTRSGGRLGVERRHSHQ